MRSMIFLLIFLLFSTFLSAQTPSCPFNKGFNLAAWFEGESAKDIPNWYSKKRFQDFLMLGCDVIRLPINLNSMSGGAPDYTIDPVLFKFLDRTVEWAEELGLHIILDNHRTGELDANDPATTAQLVALWQQMAEHFKDRSTLVYYEVCNEPHGITDANWGEIQGRAIEAIRAIDQAHTIVVSPAGMGDIYNLDDMPVFEDDNLIYTFHYYNPMLFTHQGADWFEPSMEEITGVPYPYDAGRMPPKPSHIVGTWLEWGYDDYHNQGTKASLQTKLDVALQFRDQRQAPIYCGEFGAMQSEGTDEDRLRWYQDIGDILNDNQIGWTMWGYSGGFGIFKKDLLGFPQDLDLPLVEALGLTVPPPGPYPIVPDSGTLVLYDDLLSAEVNDVSFGAGTKDYWNDIDPKTGDYCISWKDAGQYANISWKFSGNRDLFYLLESGYTLSFWMKANAPNMRFDVRFLDTDLFDGVDHPWRMTKTIDKNNATLDGTWGLVEIPLTEMIDSGSWHNNAWYDSEEKFDWTKIDKLEFVAELQSLEGIEVKFDEVQILKVYRPELSLLKPNGGEKLRAGSTQSITWTSNDIRDVKIDYTPDNGTTWNVIQASVPAINQKYDWQVPEISSNQCRIKISSLDGTLEDISNSTFSILDPVILLTAPNGGEKFRAGSTQSITWTSIDINDVKIDYTSDNGTTWDVIQASAPAVNQKYDWQVPEISSSQCRIKIRTLDVTLEDISDSTFTILDPFITVTSPNGDELWEVRSTQNITWTSQDVNNVKIEYSVNNGANWETAASQLGAEIGNFEWTVPDSVSQECLIKVSDNLDTSISDVSDAVFEIDYPASVENRNAVPDKLQLFGNYPNPFNPQTTIKFGIPEKGHVKLTVYNNLGQIVSIFVDEQMDSGYHKVLLNSNSFSTARSSGIYFYRIDFEQSIMTGKMILMQ
jgi:endoglucanase